MGKKKREIIKEIDEENDIAYIGFPTNSSTIGIDLDNNITIHLDTKKNKIIGITILHWKRVKEKLELKERAKESIKTITDYMLKNYSKMSILPCFFYKKFLSDNLR